MEERRYSRDLTVSISFGGAEPMVGGKQNSHVPFVKANEGGAFIKKDQKRKFSPEQLVRDSFFW